MTPLFSAEGDAALAALARRSALYAFDFDGTLAPIVPRPDDARAPASTVERLERLGAVAPVVVITGRGVADLGNRLPFRPRFVVGNHGAEGMPVPIGRGTRDEHAAAVSAWRAQWTDALGAGADPGIEVEDKTYSLSVHFRATRDPVAAEAAVLAAAGKLVPPPRRIAGKMVVNLLPEGAADKGQALAGLVRHDGRDAAFFIGDDVTDEVAFENAPASWVTVRVGNVPDSHARFYVPDQADIDAVIDRLLASRAQ